MAGIPNSNVVLFVKMLFMDWNSGEKLIIEFDFRYCCEKAVAPGVIPPEKHPNSTENKIVDTYKSREVKIRLERIKQNNDRDKNLYLLINLTNSTKNIIFVEFGLVSCLKFAIPTSKDSKALNIHNKNDNKIVLEFIYLFINLIIWCENAKTMLVKT